MPEKEIAWHQMEQEEIARACRFYMATAYGGPESRFVVRFEIHDGRVLAAITEHDKPQVTR